MPLPVTNASSCPPPHVRLLNDAEFAQVGGHLGRDNNRIFSQCLLNVDYVMWLASEGYFQDEAFLNYLKYLEYLRQRSIDFVRFFS